MQPDLFQSSVREPRSQEEVRNAWRECAVGLLNAGIPFTLISRERLQPDAPEPSGGDTDSEAPTAGREKDAWADDIPAADASGSASASPMAGLRLAPVAITEDEPVIHTLMDLKALIARVDPKTNLPGAVVGLPVGTCLVIQDVTTDQDQTFDYLKRSLRRTVSMRYPGRLIYLYRLPQGPRSESPVRLKGNVVYDPRHQALPIPAPRPGKADGGSVSWHRGPDEVQVLPLPGLLRRTVRRSQ